jgi:hypothetical protein
MTTLGQFGLTPRGVWVLAALTCAAGAAAAVFWPRDPLPGPRSVKGLEVRWSVPAPLRVESDQALSTINRRPLWALAAPGTPGAALARPDEPPLTPPDWRIVGTVINGAQRLVLVSTLSALPAPPVGGAGLGLPPQPPQALRVGDALPGGARILEIRPDGVCLSLKGRHVFLSTTPQ